jgi:class 3 adenylate cyclase
MTLPVVSFRLKLLGAMLVVVVGISGAVLYVSQQQVAEFYRKKSHEQFAAQIEFFSTLREERLGPVRESCLKLTETVRLKAALQENDPLLLYENGVELARDVLESRASDRVMQKGSRGRREFFFIFVDPEGAPILPPAVSGPMMALRSHLGGVRDQLKFARKALKSGEVQEIGYLSITHEKENESPRPGATVAQRIRERISSHLPVRDETELHEVVVTKVIDATAGGFLGGLVVGFGFPDLLPGAQGTNAPLGGILSAIYLDGKIHGKSAAISPSLQEALAKRVAEEVARAPGESREFSENFSGVPYRVFCSPLNRQGSFPPAYQICLSSQEDEVRDRAAARRKIAGFGVMGLVGAFLLSVLLSHGLTVPINEVVAGTAEIRRGNFNVKVPVRSRDDIGVLARSFNEMAGGLAEKERFRRFLDMVTDKAVAQKMIEGKIPLGGELREVSIIFCDIRGFTALTSGMPPSEVIQMLNEHMTALSEVVTKHGGVVDKYVGDLIMANFGAPESRPDEAWHAVNCALSMLHERRLLNEISKHKIEVGIGIATGEVVAGSMGSETRANYTVLGERVNLASRLCGKAGRMEIVIDEATRAKLCTQFTFDPLPPLELKGFSEKVCAYKVNAINAP